MNTRTLLLAAAGLIVGCKDTELEVHEIVYLPPLSVAEVEPYFEPPPPAGRLEVSPEELDFGPVSLGCALTLPLTLTNDGVGDLAIAGVALGVGTTAELSVPTWAGVLGTGESVTVEVVYQPTDVGEDVGSVTIQSDEGGGDLRAVVASGQDSPGLEGVERFVQEEIPPADILWVIDNSSSMDAEVAKVVDNFELFMEELYEAGIDYHMGFVTTSMPTGQGQLQGEYNSAGQPYITTEMGQEGLDALLAQMMLALTVSGSGNEMGLDAMAVALSDENLATRHAGFLREGARLVVTAVSDEDDFSSAPDVAFYEDRLLELKGGDRGQVSFSAIVGLPPSAACARAGTRYLDMVSRFNGYRDDVCQDSYQDMMATLGGVTAGDAGLFRLEGHPELAYPITVALDGVVLPEGEQWSYLASENAVELAEVPEVGAEVEITYTQVASCGG